MRKYLKGLPKKLKLELALCAIVFVGMVSLMIYAIISCCSTLDDYQPIDLTGSNDSMDEQLELTAGVCNAWNHIFTCATAREESPVEVSSDVLEITAESCPEDYQEEELPEWFEYLCQCVEAEAGDQDYLGKCYVTDCILNRVDSDKFPNSVVEVINQKHTKKNGKTTWQFEVVMNGRINRVEVSDETREAVKDELKERKNYDMLYFCMFKFSWAEFMFKHGDHYFHK